MRKKIAAVALGIGVAASFLPITSASASCIGAWQAVTGDCSPCDEIGHVLGKPLNCIQ